MAGIGERCLRLALRAVPSGLRDAVRQDLEHEALALGHGPWWRAVSACSVACRLRWTFGVDSLIADVRYSIRSLVRARWFTLAAMMSFALGIGANVAVFSVVDRMMFRPLPYADPDRLVQIHAGQVANGSAYLYLDESVAAALRQRATAFEDVAYATGDDAGRPVNGFGDAPLFVATGTFNLLKTVGVRPIIGRDFTEDDARRRANVMLLSDDAWKTRFAASPDVLGRRFGSTGVDQVIGVLPPGFLLPSSKIGQGFDALFLTGEDFTDFQPQGRVVAAPIARLRPGVTVAAAQAQVDTILGQLQREFGAAFGPLQGRPGTVRVEPIRSGLFLLYRPYLWLIVTAVALILLIACVNLAILLLARGRSREQEAAVRAALGASRARLMATALFETLLLCLGSSAVGVATALAAHRALLSLLPPSLRGLSVPTLDARVIALALAIAVASALVAGLAPAWHATRVDVLSILQRGTNAARASRLRGGAVLLLVEAALGMMLVTGASLSIRNFLQLVFRNPGYQASDLYLGDVTRGLGAELGDRVQRIHDSLSSVPHVRAVGVSSRAVTGDPWVGDVFWKAHGENGGVWGVNAGFFDAMTTPMHAGRPFTESDINGRAHVAIVNETGARMLWPGEPVMHAVGRELSTKDGVRTVVGVVADIVPRPGAKASPALFVPITASDTPWPMISRMPDGRIQPVSIAIVLRMDPGVSPDDAALAARLRAALGDATLSLRPVTIQLAPWLERPRFQAVLFGSLAVFGLLLVAGGLYAVASFDVARRRYEIGVRMTLGASITDIRRLVVAGAVRPIVMGIGAGLVATYWAGQFLQTFLFQVDARGWTTYFGVAMVLLMTSIVAAWLPARTATRIDPAAALRMP